MKPFAKITILLAVAGAIAVPFALAGNDGGRTIELVSVQQRFATVPQMTRQTTPSIGLRMVFQDRTFNRAAQFGRPAGAQVGRAEGVCTLIAVSRQPQAQCLITAHVPDGQIVVAGEGDPGANVTHYAIVGGLGAYANVRGWVFGKALSDTKTLITIHLAS